MSENIVHQWRLKVVENGLMMPAGMMKVRIAFYPYLRLCAGLCSRVGPRLIPDLNLGFDLRTLHVQPLHPRDLHP
jgi:hypothetical protein